MSSATEWHAEEYALVSGLQAAMAAEALALVALKGTENVLDVGCGDGKITAQIAAREPGGSVVGVDPSQEMIDFARQHFDAEAYPNLRFHTADARHLDFHEAFDWVVSFNALHWIPDQDAALRSIASALKPGGVAQLRFVYKGELKSLESVIEDTRLSPKWNRFFTGFSRPYLHLTPDEYTTTAQRCGLDIVEIRTSAKAWDFKTRAAFRRFGAATFVAWTNLLPDELIAEFVDDVLDRYAGLSGDNVFRYYQMDVTAKRP